MTLPDTRNLALLSALAAGFALGLALASEKLEGLVPCALCLLERWPYRVAIVLALLAVVVPRAIARLLLVLVVLSMLVSAALGVRPCRRGAAFLAEPAAGMRGAALHRRQRSPNAWRSMPARPSKPCDDADLSDPGPADLDGGDEPALRAGLRDMCSAVSCGATGGAPHERHAARPARRSVRRARRGAHAAGRPCRRVRRGADLCRPARGAAAQRHGTGAARDAGAGAAAPRPVRRPDRRPPGAADRHAAAVAPGRLRTRRGDRGAGRRARQWPAPWRSRKRSTRTMQTRSRRWTTARASCAIRSTKFRDDELQHRDIGLEHGAEQAPGYRLLSAAIKAGCRVAIRISERV